MKYRYLLLLIPCLIQAQTSDTTKTPTIPAIRASETIRIDGQLDETIWQRPGSNGFTQRDPDEGKPATQKTDVWCAYDDAALYFAANLQETTPDSIVGRLGRRDAHVESDWFKVFLDPYHDGRTGVYFGVNPSGAIQDGTLFNDNWRDNNWDGVWESGVFHHENGWTVEMRIPYSQLRFAKKDEHIWGINFARQIQRREEVDYFVMVPKDERCFVSRFADLTGIRQINPPKRIEFMPYVVGSAQSLVHDADDPFYADQRTYKNFGADLKIGLGPNLTLDATINPDFGQVEVDPAVINLSDFETFFREKRPFFIEGSHIFDFGEGGATSYSSINFGTPDFFYSRRVGRSPQGYPDHDGFVDMPDRTSILGAGKLSGKVADGWSLGVVSAVTSREYARNDTSGVLFKEEVEPLSSYTVLRSQKEFNEGRQAIGMIGTGLVRDLRSPMLRSLLNEQASSFGLDGWTFLDKDKTWVITGWTAGTMIKGSSDAVLRVQQGGAHYFQRPDVDHVTLDSTATSMSGWAGRLYLNKEKGNWRINAALGAISPGFDTNDMGFQWRSDIINGHIGIGYNWYKPDKVFRSKGIMTYVFRNYDFGGNKTGEGYFMFGNAQFLNYWGFHFMAAWDPETLSGHKTRGGPMMLNPGGGFADISFYSDSRKTVSFGLGGSYSSGTEGSREWSTNMSVDIKPNSQINISLSPRFGKDYPVAQWVTMQEDPLAEATYAGRYIFADMEQTTISMSTRINWTFTPKLSFQLYMQPFFASGKYSGFKELARARSFDFNTYGENGSEISVDDVGDYSVDPDGAGPAEAFVISNPDFNYKSLRGTALLRWEYRPGSVLYLVWTHDRADFEHPGEFRFHRDFRSLANAESNNIFLVKLTYWWNP